MLPNTKYSIGFRGVACVQKVDNTATWLQLQIMQCK